MSTPTARELTAMFDLGLAEVVADGLEQEMRPGSTGVPSDDTFVKAATLLAQSQPSRSSEEAGEGKLVIGVPNEGEFSFATFRLVEDPHAVSAPEGSITTDRIIGLVSSRGARVFMVTPGEDTATLTDEGAIKLVEELASRNQPTN